MFQLEELYGSGGESPAKMTLAIMKKLMLNEFDRDYSQSKAAEKKKNSPAPLASCEDQYESQSWVMALEMIGCFKKEAVANSRIPSVIPMLFCYSIQM